MKRVLLACTSLIAVFLISSCSEKLHLFLADEGTVIAPSMTRTLSSPDNFLSREVHLKGYLYSDDLDSHLFLTKDHSEMADLSSAILLGKGEGLFSLCNERYVMVVGTLVESEIFLRLELTNIDRVVDPNTLTPCWQSDARYKEHWR